MLHMLHCSSGAGVTIGFVNTTYSVNEGDFADVAVGVLSGVLSEDVVVVLTTRDDSATGTF